MSAEVSIVPPTGPDPSHQASTSSRQTVQGSLPFQGSPRYLTIPNRTSRTTYQQLHLIDIIQKEEARTYSPRQRPGKKYSPRQRPGKKYSPRQRPGKKYLPRQRPGKKYSPRQRPGKRYSPRLRPRKTCSMTPQTTTCSAKTSPSSSYHLRW